LEDWVSRQFRGNLLEEARGLLKEEEICLWGEGVGCQQPLVLQENDQPGSALESNNQQKDLTEGKIKETDARAGTQREGRKMPYSKKGPISRCPVTSDQGQSQPRTLTQGDQWG